MSHPIEEKLAQAGVTLPDAAAPAANYVATTLVGGLLHTSGQLPMADGKLFATGLLGEAIDLQAGQETARHCALNVLAQAKAACDGDFGRIKRLVKLTVFVASAPGFTDQHKVANGASNFMVEVMGEAGRHIRSAVGVASLPMNAPVEIEAIFELG